MTKDLKEVRRELAILLREDLNFRQRLTSAETLRFVCLVWVKNIEKTSEA